ncbi:exodeoxyribonuclease III [Geoalkalibacter halelectricus]|uniref:Exodeoxyribonuclease III n=1 Tax=Geoalkalibacter halelectricus TaxID=2847045 RepID=A0ABY5ZQ14_9BACT|nr:exodeoxyribonuclease III [Geoalkalibacter halelectricus]MDO3379877.1 exodeoxyribonuclease III [Geoalkalibacter halelectricus]UWZ80594.1 exodeoxyribonuclease III [Geoalkalibacter halelectricus]
MKLVCFNVNGLRSRLHQLKAVIDKYEPEILGLQETKVQDADFPVQAVQDLGYHVAFHGQKTHYGVALLSRHEPTRVQFGLPDDGEEAQKRFISGDFILPSGQTLRVINGYFPQGENREHPVKFPAKRRFYAELLAYLKEQCNPEQPLVVMGDFNIAPVDGDIGIGPENAKRWLRTGKTSFLPEEREWFAELQEWGLRDSFRELYPDIADRFSWFDYRSRGFEDDPKRGLRIDHILMTSPVFKGCSKAGIDYDIRAMEKPSDHCPVWAEVALE